MDFWSWEVPKVSGRRRACSPWKTAHKRSFQEKVVSRVKAGIFRAESQAERRVYGPVRLPAKQQDSLWNYTEAQKEFDRRLLTEYAPATVFVNEEMEILHTRGDCEPIS